MAIESFVEEMGETPMEPITTEDGTVIEQDGDDIIVDYGDDDSSEFSSEHDANLAEDMQSGERVTLGQKLIEMVDADLETRKPWEARIIQGMEIIGVEDIPSDVSAFDGASTVTHPAIAEAMVRFQANAMEELFPAEGPVKTTVVGKSDPEKERQSDRVREFMNWQLTDADDQYFEETDQMCMYLPYAGSAFKKVYHDITDGVSLSRFVDAQHFIVPYDATSLAKSPRYTHWYTLTGPEIAAKIDSGEFIDTDQLDPSGTGQPEDGRELEDKSDDKVSSRHEDDVVYDIYEIHIEMVLEGDERKTESENFPLTSPYVVTVEKESGEILAIRRLWKEGDEKRRKQVQFIHYKFLPGLGFYGWGYLHIIGALGKAASGALRALLDGSATASLQGGFKSKESKLAGEFVFTPGVWKDVDMTAEDLAKSFYTPPFKEPSPALFHTLELLVNGIQGFSSTTEAMTGTADNRGPVGTTLALIEQGSKVYSGIHKRMHKAARMEFKMLAYLNFLYMEDEYPYDVEGGRQVLKQDFDGRVDIIPVSDPNIYSNVQRVAQAQGMMELIQQGGGIYDNDAIKEAHRDMMRAMRIPSPERFLPKKTVRRVDPVTENQSLLTGGTAKAFPEQDHQSHIAVHQMFMMEVEGMGLEPQVFEAFKLSMMAHMAEHYAHAYRLRIEQELGAELPPTDFQDTRDDEDMPIEIDTAVARAVAGNIAPPPPPQAALDEQQMKEDEHKQKLRHKDEEHQQRLAHEADEHELEMKQRAEESEMGIRKKAADNILDTAGKAAKLQE